MTGPVDTVRVAEPFATSVRRGIPLVWASGVGDQQSAILGWGEALRLSARGTDRFQELNDSYSAWIARYGVDAGNDSNPVAFVTVAFDAESAVESVLIVPELLGRWAHGELVVTRNVVPATGVSGSSPIELPEPSEPREFEDVELLPGQLTSQRYRDAVGTAVELIAAGEVDKVVIARDLVVSSPKPVDVPGLVARLQHANSASWTFQVDGMVGSSPEMLIARRGRRARSQVLAGSAPVTGDDGVDEVTADELLASAKNRSEHEYSVRSVADRLATVADVVIGDLQVKRLPRIMHLSTKIEGTLRKPLSALELAGIVHPSAAVCGTPTEAALRIIDDLEGFDRGRYAGPVGWLDAQGDGEFAIALRCGQVAEDGRSIRLCAGGGIVAGSVPDDELAETAQKFLPMYDALRPAAQP